MTPIRISGWDLTSLRSAIPSKTTLGGSWNAAKRSGGDALGLVGPVAVFEEALVELAGGVAGEFGLEVDRTRALEPGEVLLAVGDQLPFQLGPGVGHVHRLHDGL